MQFYKDASNKGLMELSVVGQNKISGTCDILFSA
jgi:hypothetical protein